jgi:hypothetical protein
MAGDNLPRFTFPAIVGRPVIRAEEAAIEEGELKVTEPPFIVFGCPLFAMARLTLPCSRRRFCVASGHHDWRRSCRPASRLGD